MATKSGPIDQRVTVTASLKDTLSAGLGRLGTAFKNLGTTLLSGIGKGITAFGQGLLSLPSIIGKALGSIFNLRNGLIALATTFGLIKLNSILKDAVNALGDLRDRADRLGFTVEQLAPLEFIFAQVGVEAEAAALSFKTLQEALSTAVEDPSSGAAKSFRELGLTMRDIARPDGSIIDVNSALLKLSDGLKALPNQADRVRLAQDLLGKAGTKLLPALQNGASALRDQIAEGRALNPVTTKAAEIADRWGDAYVKVNEALKGLKLTMIETLGPIAAATLENLAQLIAKIRVVAQVLIDAFGAVSRDDSLGAQVRVLLLKLRDVLLGTIGRLAADIGTFFVLALVETMKILLETFGPVLADLFKQFITKPAKAALSSYVLFVADNIRVVNDGVADALVSIVRGGEAADAILEKQNSDVAAKAKETADKVAAAVARMKEAYTALKVNATNDTKDVVTLFEQLQKVIQKIRDEQQKIEATSEAPNTIGISGDRWSFSDLISPELLRFLNDVQAGIQDVALRVGNLKVRAQEIGGVIGGAIFEGIPNALADAALGVGNLKDAFLDLGRQVVQSLARIITQLLWIQLLKSTLSGTVAGTALGFADGGLIPGRVSNVHRDDTMIRARQGEFVQPVESVRYYPLSFMEAIRRRTFPRWAASAFAGGAMPRTGERRGYVDGGMIAASMSNAGVAQAGLPRSGVGGGIMAATPAQMRRLMTGSGQVMNDFMRDNAGAVTSALKGGRR